MDKRVTAADGFNEALVLDCTAEEIIVVAKDGDFHRIAWKPGVKPGDQIYYFAEDLLEETIEVLASSSTPNATLKKRGLQSLVAIAAAILLLLVVNLPFFGETMALMSIDINPSVELELDRKGKVVRVLSLNADATKLTDNLSLKGNHYELALTKLIEQAKQMGYDVENHSVLIAVAPISIKAVPLVEEMKSKLQLETMKQQLDFIVSEDTWSQGQPTKLSLGRTLLGQRYQNVSREDIEQLSIKALHKKIKALNPEAYPDDQDELEDEDKDYDKDKDYDEDEDEGDHEDDDVEDNDTD